MRSSERLRYLPEPLRASEWEEEEEEEEKEEEEEEEQEEGKEAEAVDNAVVCWPVEEPALVVWDAPREEESQNRDIELFVNEMLRRKNILIGASRKRKASVSGNRLRDYLVTSDSSGYSSEAASPESTSSFDSDSSISSPIFWKGPIARDQSILDNFPKNMAKFTSKLLEEISIPMSGWNPTTMTLAPTRPAVLDNPTNQELLAIYIKLSAKRLSDTSPSHLDLFGKYIPAMAHGSPALMEGILALAALQTGLMTKNPRIMAVDAVSHYQKSLKAHFRAVSDPNFRNRNTDSMLATSIILSHYEIWNGENVKMGVHMLGGRDIILARGKAAHMTPVGRTLYAAFKRADIATSSITGNPTFMTNDWWTVDPFTRVPITHDSPVLQVADAALAKLCVICCRLTHLKSWTLQRRRNLWVRFGGDPPLEQRENLQSSIDLRVSQLDQDLDAWYAEIPTWFRALDDDPETGDNGEEDINSTRVTSILPRRYPHICIGLVHGWAIGVRVQLFRMRYPEALFAPPNIGSLCHAALRIFAFLPTSTDASIVVPIFVAGMELRQKCHQDWLTKTLNARIDETGFHAMIFLRDGLRFAWLKLEGVSNGRFNLITEGAASKIDGVSENLWAAEGMLGSLEKLSLYDSAETTSKRNVFKGDIDMSGFPEDVVPYEAPDISARDVPEGKLSPASSSPASKRFKSESPEVPEDGDTV